MFAGLESNDGARQKRLSTNKVLVAIRDGFLVGTLLIIVASISRNCQLPGAGYSDFMAILR